MHKAIKEIDFDQIFGSDNDFFIQSVIGNTEGIIDDEICNITCFDNINRLTRNQISLNRSYLFAIDLYFK